MIRRFLWPAVVLAMAVAAVAVAEPDTTQVPLPGTARGDTLLVMRSEVVAAALKHNEMLAASSAMNDAASAEAQGALRAFLPQVQLGTYFLRSDDALSSFGFKLQNRSVTGQDFNPTVLNDPGETNNFIMQVKLMQPIFNGGMGIGGKKAANAMSRAAEHQHRRAAETVQFHAVQAFEGLVLAGSYEKVMATAVKTAESHVRQADAMVANEMATQADLLQAQVYLSGLQQQLIEVRNMKEVAAYNIKLLTNAVTDLEIVPVISAGEFTESDLPPRPDRLVISGRSDLLARREEADAAGAMVTVANGSVLPHVNMSLQRDYYSRENLFADDARSWTLGVYATWDIFKGMQNIGEIKKARAHQRAAEYMVSFESRQAEIQATEAWLKARAALEKVAVADNAVTAAQEGLRIVSNQYREGLASMVDLLDTQAAAVMAEGNQVQARHDLAVGLAGLEYFGPATQSPTPQGAETPEESKP